MGRKERSLSLEYLLTFFYNCIHFFFDIQEYNVSFHIFLPIIFPFSSYFSSQPLKNVMRKFPLPLSGGRSLCGLRACFILFMLLVLVFKFYLNMDFVVDFIHKKKRGEKGKDRVIFFALGFGFIHKKKRGGNKGEKVEKEN